MRAFTLLVLALLAAPASAIPNPSSVYCDTLGYDVQGDLCVFPDGTSCEAWEFYRGECGASKVKELPCAAVGESKKPGVECCAGLSPTQISTPASDGMCMSPLGSWPVCLACGDGVCGEGENSCNSPKDCSDFCECEAVFSHCSCGWVCVKKTDGPRADCAMACPGLRPPKPDCSCESGSCAIGMGCSSDGDCPQTPCAAPAEDEERPCAMNRCINGMCKLCGWECMYEGSRSEGWYDSCSGRLIRYDNCAETEPSTPGDVGSADCGIDKPCPKGLECIKFPGKGLSCAFPDPCGYYECPKGTECAVAESYPPQVICSGDTGDDAGEPVSHEVPLPPELPDEGELLPARPTPKISVQEAIDAAEESMPLEAPKASLSKAGQVYIVMGIRSAHLFAIIPVDVPVTTHVDARTGKVIKSSGPWWDIFAW